GVAQALPDLGAVAAVLPAEGPRRIVGARAVGRPAAVTGTGSAACGTAAAAPAGPAARARAPSGPGAAGAARFARAARAHAARTPAALGGRAAMALPRGDRQRRR